MNTIIHQQILPTGQSLAIVLGDLTQEKVDAIVNAANAGLQHGGGVAGAIRRQGGPQIQAESDAWVRAHGPVSHAEPAYTRAGNMPARYVIHAVGPVWGSGDEDAKLAAAVRGSLQRASELSLASIAFPAISTGIFGFPAGRAARVMLAAIHAYFAAQVETPLREVRIVLVDPRLADVFVKTL